MPRLRYHPRSDYILYITKFRQIRLTYELRYYDLLVQVNYNLRTEIMNDNKMITSRTNL